MACRVLIKKFIIVSIKRARALERISVEYGCFSTLIEIMIPFTLLVKYLDVVRVWAEWSVEI